ncbi:SAM-dependent methyltransferase [Actinoallomurus vinaceus]|uniref:SAM-dependent methyltransferase n=1 Tax=Actinoallomurus vinaceus TaxID=1080074 RepID=A0ABP8U2J9_9ACTN
MPAEEPPRADDTSLPDIPLGVPTAARMYDEALGGKDHFQVDRDANARLYKIIGEDRVRSTALENRRFLGRAVRHLAHECGIRQFLDVGSGLPSARNTHQIAQEVDPAAKVVYVDIDPIVAAHGKALLSRDGTRIVTADMREPETILDDPQVRELIDFSRPVAVLFVAVFHFVTPAEDPARIVAAFRGRQAPGSYVTISHLTSDGVPPEDIAGWEAGFAGATSPIVFRTEKEIQALFDGYEMVEPGLVRPHTWHPDDDGAPRTTSLFGGVGRLPAR